MGILVELAAALGTRVGTLFGEDVEGAPLATFTPDAPRHTAAGLEIASSSGFPDSRALEALRVHVPADREPSVPARHRGEEWIYVLRGTLQLEFDGVLYELRKDMAAHFDATRPHRLSAARTGRGASPGERRLPSRPHLDPALTQGNSDHDLYRQ